MNVQPHQIKTIHVLLGKLKMKGDELKEYKRDLVQQYTGGREVSTTKLLHAEAVNMIADLQTATPKTTDELKADLQRKKILHYAHQMRWELESGKVDVERVNNWCVKYGYLHKGLNEYTVKELPRLVTQFDSVYKSFLEAVY